MSRMVDACRAQGVPEPEYEVNGGFVRIVFCRAMGKTTGTIVESSLEGMELARSWQGVRCGLFYLGTYRKVLPGGAFTF